MGRNMQLVIIDENGVERASHKLGYGTKVFVKEGEKIERGTKLFEWDPYTLPIIAEKAGVAKFVDLISGISVREETDDATGMTQKIVTDWRAAPRGNDLKPEIIIMDRGTANRSATSRATRSTYPMSVDAILSVEDGQDMKAGDVVARIPREGAKTKDITGGLPRVAELFEARRPKDHAIIAEIDGYVRFGQATTRTSAGSRSSRPTTRWSRSNTWCRRASTSRCRKATSSRRATTSWTATRRRTTSCGSWGSRRWPNYMIDEVQDVYRLQGVKINDKHIEVIVRQMLQKWEILDSGETTLLKGEHVDKAEFDEANDKAATKGGRPATGEPILLGITKASLQTRSFISAASFQETTRVLTEASVRASATSWSA